MNLSFKKIYVFNSQGDIMISQSIPNIVMGNGEKKANAVSWSSNSILWFS